MLIALVAVPTATAAYPGGNGKIAFASDRDPDGIYVMNPDGSHEEARATAFPDSLREPEWSPDGMRIAFVNDSSTAVRVMNADGTGKKTLAVGRSPTWSPDGTKIAYIGYADGWGVYVMNADGTDQTKLYDAAGLEPDALAWSPDGAALLVSGAGGIRLANADGSGGITSLGTGANADWSPDGTRIALAWGSDIYVMNRDGTGLVPITNDDVRDDFPAWSPDGTRVVFERESDDGYSTIAVVNADGSGLRNLTDGMNPNTQPDWQPLSLQLRSSRSTVDYRRPFTVRAHLFWAGRTTNGTVSLYRIPSGGSKALVARKAVDGAGDAAFRVTARKRTTYVLEWAGDGTHGPASDAVVVQVRALTKARLSGHYGASGRYALYRLGTRIALTGTVVPKHAGKRMLFTAEKRVGRSWRRFAEGAFRIKANGSVTAYLAPGTRGAYRVRTTFLGDRDHLRSSSAWKYLKVT
jgi:TolB protein